MFQHLRLRLPVDDRMQGAVKLHLVSVYAGRIGQALKSLKDERLTKSKGVEIIERAKQLRSIAIVSLGVKKMGEDLYVTRTQFTISGRPPPDGKGVRYFVMKKAGLGSWRVQGEASALQYYLTLW